MGFEELLRKRLGPLKDLVARPNRPPPESIDPSVLFYRRAAGIEARVRPEETWATFTLGMPPHLKARRAEEARRLMGLTEWTSAEDAGLDAATLWRAVEDDLLVYAPVNPERALAGRPGVLDSDRSTFIARRASAWPTCAVETAVEIAPMPFMPRGRDLVSAELVGARVASLERGHEVLGVTITGTGATGRRLRRLWPMLDGRMTFADVLARFDRPDRHDAEKLLRLLDSFGLLEARAAPPAPADRVASPDRAQVTWLGHAAVLLQTTRTNLLVDPLFFAPSDPPDPWDSHPRFDPRALPPIDAVLVTHGDNDHLNPNSLAMLDPDTPVLIPECPRYPSGFQVDLKGVLQVLGFRRIVEMPVGTVHSVGDVQVSAWPFDGEDWGLDLTKATYLVESPEVSVYFSADAARMDDVMDAIGARDRQVDLAFMGVSGNAEPHVTSPDLGYGNFYADWVPRQKHNQWVQHCAGPADAAESVGRLRPRYAFGYACGGASYIQTAYSDVGDHATFARLVAESREVETVPVDLPLGRPVSVGDLQAHASAYISP